MTENTIYIKELNPEIIAPSTKSYLEEGNFGGSKTMVIGKPGCMAINTPILMYDCSEKMVQDIEVGDIVMGDDSTPRTVLELCRNIDEMYDVVPNKGEKYTVNKQHILVLKASGGLPKIEKGTEIHMTVDEFLKKGKSFQEHMKIFRVPLQFDYQKVDIEPYLLGLWLGDGNKNTTEITNIDEEIISFLQNYCKENNMCLNQKGESITYYISSDKGTKLKNNFKNALRQNNLLRNKHIPIEYKRNSREIRLQLLAGLLDTDGSYDEKGNGFDFIQKNERLFNDFLFLARSLGFSAYKRKTNKSCTHKGKQFTGIYFRCFVSGKVNEIPCKINRKIARFRKINKDNLVSGFKLIPKGEDQYYGFTLDGNHKFLLPTCDVLHNTGKSTLIASLLYAKKSIFPVGIAFSGSEDSNGFFRKIMPSTFVFNEYNEDQIKSFIRRQKIAKQHLINPWSVIILDDCTDDPRVFNTPLQQGIFKRGRHWSMWYIVSLQYAMDVKPVIRTNVDGVFILREPILKNRKALWENYASIIPDFTTFCSLMDQLTDDFCCMYVSNQSKSNNWQDCVFWYKASPVPADWKFGCDEYYQFHEDRFNTAYVDPFD